MLNHFRTLLLNLRALDESEHIPSSFKPKTLPADLTRIYNKLFPPNCSRFYKFYLTQNYLLLLKAVGLQDHITRFDNRISYPDAVSTYFKVNRSSNPAISNSEFPIRVLSNIQSVTYSDYHFDIFTISQDGSYSNVNIFSKVKNRYLKNKDEFVSTSSESLVPVTFTSGNKSSNVVYIGQTGASFIISNLSSGAFTDTSNKTWEFISESPFSFDILSIAGSINSDEVIKILGKYISVAELEAKLTKEQNPLFKLGLIISSYVDVINKL